MDKILKSITSFPLPLWAPENEGAGAGAASEESKTEEEVKGTEGAAEDKTEETAAPPKVEGEEKVEGSADKPEVRAEAPKADWRDKRIATLTARLAEAKTAGAKEEPSNGTLDEAEVDRRATAKAQQMAAQNSFNEACAKAAQEGKASFADFNDKLAGLQRVVDRNDPSSVLAYDQFLFAGLETEALPKLIYMMGSDLDEAARILALPPLKMAVELTKLANKDPGEISKAFKPIKPVGANIGAAHTSITADDKDRADNLSTTEWMKRREAQVDARNSRR